MLHSTLVEWCWHLTIATSPVQYLKKTHSLLNLLLFEHEFRLISVKNYIKENKPYTELFVFYFLFSYNLFSIEFYYLRFHQHIERFTIKSK